MNYDEFIKKIKKYYIGELNDSKIYEELAKNEKNKTFSEKLKNLSMMEKYHAEFYKNLLKKRNAEIPVKSSNLIIKKAKIFRKIFGLNLTLKYFERSENRTVRDYYEILDSGYLENEEREIMKKIIEDEAEHEDFFEQSSYEVKERTDRIKDSVYGISDGLVEVLASVSGLAPVIINHIFVAIGGFLVGISGTLSMSLGAYLSSKAEKNYNDSKIRTKKIIGKSHEEQNVANPIKSALYTGIFYIIGASIPILSYFFYSGITAIIVSFTLVIITEAILGSIIALLTNNSILKSAIENASMTFFAALATLILGTFIHNYFHINI
ncbi:MAG: VIT1/CCC1 transporter family protein [Thermoplasmata archaeon]